MTDLTPYPGLRPFQSEEDYLFFGREEQIADLTERLQQHRFVAVVGSSGSGKSSLVRCGLLSQLQGGMMVGAGASWQIAVMQPGGDPLGNLANALINAELYDEDEEDIEHHVMATINRSTNGLVEAVKQADLEENANILLVVDQFEEIFRFHEAGQKGEELAPDFIRWLIHAVKQNEVPIYIVLTMRSDFLGDCARFTGLAEAINNGEYLVPKLTRDQVQQAIEGPARVAGGNVSRRLIQRLLNDVGEQADQLPVLQHALMRSWDHAKASTPDGSHPEVDLEDYEAVGSMANALSNHADEILDEITTDAQDESVMLRTTERIFKALTEKGIDGRGIRRPTRLSELTKIADVSVDDVLNVINAYRAPGRTFLMPGVATDLENNSVIDISHESLMRVWKRLDHWVDEESQSVRIYSRLSDTASLWQRGKAGLYRDPDLQIALSWVEQRKPNQAWAIRYDNNYQLALRFLENSDQEQHEEERKAEEARKRELEQAQQLADEQRLRAEEQEASFKRSKKLSRLIAGVAGLAVVATIVAVFAMFNAWEKEDLANEARATAEDSRIKLAAAFRDNDIADAQKLFANYDTYNGLLILQEAYERNPEDKELIKHALDGVTQSNQLYPSPSFISPHATERLFTLNNDYAYISSNSEGWLQIHKTRKVENNGTFTNVDTIKLTGLAEHVELFNNSLQVLTTDGHAYAIDYTKFSVETITVFPPDPDGNTTPIPIETAGFGGKQLYFYVGDTLYCRDMSKPTAEATEFRSPEGGVITHATVSADGRFAILTSDENIYHIYSLESPDAPIRSVPGDSEVQFLGFLPLQNQFLAIEDDNLLCTFSPTREDLDTVHHFPTINAKKYLISPDSTRITALGFNGSVNSYHLVDLSPVFQENSPIHSLKFDDLKYDPTGIYLGGLNSDKSLTILDSLTGETSSRNTTHPVTNGEYVFTWNIQPKLGSHELFLVIPNADYNGSNNAVIPLKLQLTTPYGQDALPNFAAIDFSQLDDETGKKFFQTLLAALVESGKSNPYLIQRLPPGIQPAFEYLFVRESNAIEIDSEVYQTHARKKYFEERANQTKPISLSTIMASRYLTPLTLAGTLQPGEEGATNADWVTRYHIIKRAQQYILAARGEEKDIPIASKKILEILATNPDLLEARSQAYEDQVHKGIPIDLTSPSNIKHWEGMQHVWNTSGGELSFASPQTTYSGTNNQYIVWRAANFSDFQIEFRYFCENGNSGITIRGIQPTEANKVANAGHIHAMLREGYQPDFLAVQPNRSSNYLSFMGSIIIDNGRYGRPLIAGPRGKITLTLSDGTPKSLARSPLLDSNDLLTNIENPDTPTDVTVTARGSRIQMFMNNHQTSTIFDSFESPYDSGDISFQGFIPPTKIQISNVLVTPLGRDLAEAELHSTSSYTPAPTDHANLLIARHRWADAASLINHQKLVTEQTSSDKALLRQADLRRRHYHRLLTKACFENDIETVQYIIDMVNDETALNTIAYGAVGDIGYSSQWGFPLFAASMKGATDVLQLLIDNGVKPDQRNGAHGITALGAAGIANQPESAKILLDAGADPNKGNGSGYSTVHEAAKWGGTDVLEIILSNGGDVTQVVGNGQSALQLVASIYNSSLQFGKSEYAKYAVTDRRLDMARYLVEKGLDPNSPYNSNRTAIQIARNVGDTELADLLESLAKDSPDSDPEQDLQKEPEEQLNEDLNEE